MWTWLSIYLRYVFTLLGIVGVSLLLLTGHWLGMVFLAVFALAIIVAVGQGLNKTWAHKLAQMLFGR